MSEPIIPFWTASDGIRLAYHELGAGRPVILIHGFFSDANMNWIKFGHPARIASDGFRVIMSDLRADGRSGKSDDPEYYPRGILARDLRELVDHLGLVNFDLGGFSLGGSDRRRGSRVGMRLGKAVLAGTTLLSPVVLRIGGVGLGISAFIGSELAFPPNRPPNRRYSFLRKSIFARLDYMVSQTSAIARWFERSLRVSPDRSVVIPNLVSRPPAGWSPAQFASRGSVTFSAFVAVGRLDWQKASIWRCARSRWSRELFPMQRW